MLVIDASAFISLGVGNVLDTLVDEFDICMTEVVLDELAETATYADRHGDAADTALEARDTFDIFSVSGSPVTTSRVDVGEASCVALTRSLDADFLLTNDYRALPELQAITECEVAVSPIVLRALVSRDVLTEAEARETFETAANGRDWLEAPIYRHAQRLFE
ncbi:hypothetical protein [Halobaculum gomorrense]|uniref:PIN domain-containing protein n=1 Tax=Halobaculum gomorrense TaxID=43928 RepID=A0A1M5UZZ0_9EURY|nr:hypothetical protein [Halobaculum gomorrense]SHH68263.1 hypothetical protein SAMN05443636_3188 [Halobaculum gomorrense]